LRVQKQRGVMVTLSHLFFVVNNFPSDTETKLMDFSANESGQYQKALLIDFL